MAPASSIPETTAVIPTEERTEPFSQSEIEARFGREPAPHIDTRRISVPLDQLQVDDSHSGIRILVRDLTNSVVARRDNCLRWVALRDNALDNHQVLAVTQTHRDIKFVIRIPEEPFVRPPLWCELYYDPASDNQVLYNRSDEPIVLDPRSPQEDQITIYPGSSQYVVPGTWRISVRRVEILDFRILEKRPFTISKPLSPRSSPSYSPAPATGKRSFTEFNEAPDRSTKKRKPSDPLAAAEPEQQEGVVMFLHKPGRSLETQSQQELSTVVAHPLMDMAENETAIIPASADLGPYQITKRNHIASSSLSEVYTAQYSAMPDCVITVKVIKTTPLPNARPQDSARNIIRQADMWLREYQNQAELAHDSIVKLHGGDARFLSLYMAHIDAKDLGSKSLWCDQSSGLFTGSVADAARILYDIASSLHYLNSRKLVHNDIKPANILYSRDEGAMLCDFGLSSLTSNPSVNGGTPYYVPPEFIGIKQRGLPSDVWALGVVMLYLLKKISLPETRAHRRHPKRLYWAIAEVNRPPPARPADGATAPTTSARSSMQQWLNEISVAKEALSPDNWLERIVGEMLAANPKQRITTDQIRHRFSSEEGQRLLEETVKVEAAQESAVAAEVESVEMEPAAAEIVVAA